MAFASVGNLGTANSNASGTTVAIMTGATVEAGNLIVVMTGWDNTDTTDTPTGGSGHRLRCSDSAGNEYTNIKERTNGQGAAASGATAAIFVAVATAELASGGTITVTSDTARVAKAASAWEFTLDADHVACNDHTSLLTDGADPGPLTLSSNFDPNREYLFLHCLAGEGPNSDAYTWDTDYTQLNGDGAGIGAAGMHVRGGFRIATITSDTVDVTSDTADRDYAQVYCSLREYTPQEFPYTTEVLDNFNRADEDPLSQGGNWEATVGATTLEVTSNQAAYLGATNFAYSNRTTEFPGDVEVWVTIATVGDSGLIFCTRQIGSGTADFYVLRASANDLAVWQSVNQTVGSGFTGWQWDTRLASALANGDEIGIRRVGNLIEVWRTVSGTWTFVHCQGDPSPFNGGRIGLMQHGTGARMDDFGGGAVTTAQQIIRYVG
jgi:hypothetical protein